MSNLFIPGEFLSHSGIKLPYKIECDSLTDEEIDIFANIIAHHYQRWLFSKVIGIPRGGLRLAKALRNKVNIVEGSPIRLVVDDVYTTGRSLFEQGCPSVYPGAVMFARAPVPKGIFAVCQLNG